MDIAILGIKYCADTEKLIKENFSDISVCTFDLSVGECPTQDFNIYIITDRLFDGVKLEPDLFLHTIENFMKNIKPDDITIINIDDDDLIKHLMGLKCNIITYGYNLKSSVTISGFEEDILAGNSEYVCSLQRSIKTLDNKSLEPCEIKIKVSDKYSSQSIIAYAAFRLAANRV